ncbi:hypothetical protein OF83DRAFT_744998 [Amylostereum chailletii]|nr:hypothetical protein OF83DRAFT_744998 [Amylostereum chailletii]
MANAQPSRGQAAAPCTQHDDPQIVQTQTPIAVRMPTEVLLEIFSHSIENDQHDAENSATTAFTISRVCRRWRDVAIDYALMWAELSFKSEAMFTIMLERARQTPLSNMEGMELRSFTFISDTLLIVACFYPLDEDDPAPSPSLRIYNFARASNAGEATPPIGALLLPHVWRRLVQEDLLVYSDPSPSWSAAAGSTVPFHISPSDRLLAINFEVATPPTFRSSTFIITFDTLLSYVKEFEASNNVENELPFSSWKNQTIQLPGHDRWSAWVCFIYGSRCVSPQPVLRDIRTKVIRVRDFHPLRRRRAMLDEVAEEAVGSSSNKVAWHEADMVIPETISNPDSLRLMLSEDNIIALEVEYTRIVHEFSNSLSFRSNTTRRLEICTCSHSEALRRAQLSAVSAVYGCTKSRNMIDANWGYQQDIRYLLWAGASRLFSGSLMSTLINYMQVRRWESVMFDRTVGIWKGLRRSNVGDRKSADGSCVGVWRDDCDWGTAVRKGLGGDHGMLS